MNHREGFLPLFVLVAIGIVVAGTGGYFVLKEHPELIPGYTPPIIIQDPSPMSVPPKPSSQYNHLTTPSPQPSSSHREKNPAPPQPHAEPSKAPQKNRPPASAVLPRSAPVPAPGSAGAMAPPSAIFSSVVREISILYANNKQPIGPDHYMRIVRDLDRAAAEGANPADIKKYRDMVEELNPGKIQALGTEEPRVAFRKNAEVPTQEEMKSIPPCVDQKFVTAPVDIAKLYSISPLGVLGPPGHTFPTEHMFFHVHPTGVSTEQVPLSAPADITVTLISFSHGFTQDPVDYTIYFALCRDAVGYYNHVKMLSPDLEAIIAAGECQFPGESKQTRCNIQTLTPVKNGARMGGVGGYQGNFDLGLFDFRKKLIFVNPARYGIRSLYIQCALNYYEPTLRSRLFALTKRGDEWCGETAQDVSGTLMGNWFFGSARADSGSDWNKYLAFVHDNSDPGLLVVSIGGVITDPKKVEFQAQNAGTINRAFRDVTPDGKIYCFESSKVSGKVLAELTSASEAKVEFQSGSCGSTEAFQKPSVYSR